MRALYIGSQDPNSCALFYRESLEELGWEVVSYDPQYFAHNNLLESFTLKLTKSPLPSKISQSDKKLLELVEKNSFQLVLVIAENFISKEVLDQIRALQSKNKPVFIYHSHDNNFSKGILKPTDFWNALCSYDLVFTTKSQNVKKYIELGQKNSHFIPSAFSPKAHRVIAKEESRYASKPFQVSFIGTYDKSRDPVFDVLPWSNLHIWGNDWKRSRHYSQHPDHIIPKAIYGKEYADITSHTQISLGLLREEAEDRHTQRTFEIPACGSLQIAPRNDEILSFFQEDKEIVCFGTLEELKDKTQYYVGHETEREKIAKKAYQRVLADGHTYTDRVKTMVKLAGL